MTLDGRPEEASVRGAAAHAYMLCNIPKSSEAYKRCVGFVASLINVDDTVVPSPPTPEKKEILKSTGKNKKAKNIAEKAEKERVLAIMAAKARNAACSAVSPAVAFEDTSRMANIDKEYNSKALKAASQYSVNIDGVTTIVANVGDVLPIVTEIHISSGNTVSVHEGDNIVAKLGVGSDDAILRMTVGLSNAGIVASIIRGVTSSSLRISCDSEETAEREMSIIQKELGEGTPEIAPGSKEAEEKMSEPSETTPEVVQNSVSDDAPAGIELDSDFDIELDSEDGLD